MGDLSSFRARVRAARRMAGRTQQQLAREIGLHPSVLSHKLNGSPGAVLNSPEAVAIMITLARWGGIGRRYEAEELLRLASVPESLVTSQAWDRPPLADLTAEPPAPTPAPTPPAPTPPAPTPPAPTPPAPAPPAGATGLWWTEERVPTLRPIPLPEPITPLIGRDEEVQAVLGMLRRSRLVTLLGAGGTGKTRLALRVAELAGSSPAVTVAFSDLAPLTNPRLIADALLRSLGVAPDAGGAAEEQLLGAVRSTRLLLVVDNLEHLTSEAGLISRLLSAAPDLRVLVTSRVVLRLYGELEFRLQPLPVPEDPEFRTPIGVRANDAVRLFCQRAQAVRPGFDPVGAELTAVVEICQLLGGLPLAIELAAARIRTFSPLAVLERLEDQAEWLATGPRDRPRRQRSLASALAWSEALLTPEQRRLFAHLGVFAGSFDAAGAAAVVEEPADSVLDLMVQLEEQSLVEPADRSDASTVPRFRLLEPVREYALARLREFTDVDQVRRRHLGYYRRTAQSMGPPRPGTDADPDLYRLFLDQANIRAALEWATRQAERDPECLVDALRLVTACGRMWSRRSLLAEGSSFLERLLDLEAQTHAAPPELRMAALQQGASFSCQTDDIRRTRQLGGEALEMSRQLDDSRVASKAHRMLGEVALSHGEIDEAMAHFELQLDFARRDGDPALTCDALNMLGQGYGRLGRLTEAQTALRASLADAECSGDTDVVGAVFGSLAEVSYLAGDLDESARQWVAGLRLHVATRTYRGVAYGLEGCATIEAARGRPRSAVEFAAAAQRIRDAGGWVLPDPERRELIAALENSIGTLTDTERRQAIADGRSRDLASIVAEAMETAGAAEPAMNRLSSAHRNRGGDGLAVRDDGEVDVVAG